MTWERIDHHLLNGQHVDITIGSARLYKGDGKYDGEYYNLTVNGERWFRYNYDYHTTVKEFNSSYDVAYGHCVLSGLGLGVLPALLLQKPEVKSITVYEISEDVIKLNKIVGFVDLNKITVINKPIEEANNIECDCLLLDHYELESEKYIMKNIESITNNINYDKVWFWKAEYFILLNYLNSGLNLNESYMQWITKYNYIPKLATLDINKLKYYIKGYFSYE
jgi:hypothetical protein